ncbi:MAG: J domain-containing protein [Mycoplasmoidaceae bacterium]|nr:MAG: J domain-containing protein [Mycoplasmoidaceae bacterium]
MATKKDYYEILEITKSASADEIKRAFRKKAMEFHPDRNKSPDAESKFKEVNEAYEVLGDPDKKSRYDQYGHAGVNEQSGFGGGGGGFSGNFADIFSSFFNQGGGSDDDEDEGQDIFSQLFGGGRRKATRSSDMKDINAQVQISFVDMVKGGKHKIKYECKENCSHCHGSGAENPKNVETCKNCHGTGTTRVKMRTPFGMMEQQGICPHCHGTGKVVSVKCHKCHGAGFTATTKEVEINIPAGVENGNLIRVGGYGNKTANGTGDLILRVMVNRSSVFERSGNKVIVKVLVDPIIAICGGKIKVPTPYGIKDVEIKPGTENGEQVIVSGSGICIKKNLFSSKEDLIAVIIYAKPTKYSKSDLDKLKDLAAQKNSEVEAYLKKVTNEIDKNND